MIQRHHWKIAAVNVGGEFASLMALISEADWMSDGLCAQTDPEAFFPEKGGSTREAKRICQGCEVTSGPPEASESDRGATA